MGDRDTPRSVGADGSRSRRELLAAVGAGAAIGTAGCSAILEGENGEASGNETDSDDTDTHRDADTLAAGGPPERDGWTVTFEDEFAAGELDRSVWQNGFGEEPLLCPYHGGRAHCAVPEQSYVEDGELVLEASAETPTVPPDERWQEGSDPEYSVGAVHTEGVFEQTLGYFEARTRVESGPGTNPAFWLFTIGDDHHEINVEFRPDRGGRLVDVGIVRDSPGGDVLRRNYEHVLEQPAAEAFHTWGIEWGPEEIAIDLDGERVHTDGRFADDLAETPMWLVFDFGVFDGAEWIGHPDPETFPRHFEIQWVRAWQREEWA